MGFIQISTALTTATENANTIAGNQFEFAKTPQLVELGLVASAVGLIVDIFVSGIVVASGFLPSTANRTPIYPDDFPLRCGMAPGDRLIIKVRNPTGGTLTLYQAIKFTPV